VASAVAQEGVSRVSSYITTKIDDKASRAHNLARLEIALSRLEFALEKTRRMPITYVSPSTDCSCCKIILHLFSSWPDEQGVLELLRCPSL
jgi:hypothetical protein